ncbi:DUF4234 domain-containing protein [Protofrankia symbiont of Coriaria ruscifolia]|uniref:DUF4234 domain-containing protein n=1 Tax=Protofrankia symbiont of Coriaria ruscifolia TaxID=1306542 RepID=UPI0010411619|nr:DUF4234 domain-containing protein [Protofrankia symbiont of Coriaria ruscifolia]
MTDQNFGPYGQPGYGQQPYGTQGGGQYGQPPYGDPHSGPGYQGQPGFGGGYPTPGTPVPAGYPQPVGAGVRGRRRNPFASWLGLPLITLGIYGIVWIYKTNKELNGYDRRIEVNPALSVLAVTLGAFLIVPPFVAVWRLGARARRAQRAAGIPELSTGVAFVIWLVGGGALYLQYEINKIWDRYPGAVEGQQVPLYA